jgi:hypothetical protein
LYSIQKFCIIFKIKVIIEMLYDSAQEVAFECVFPPANVECGRRKGEAVPVEICNITQFGVAVYTKANFTRANLHRNLVHASQVRRPFVFSLCRDAFTKVFPTPLLLGNLSVEAVDQLGD